MNTNFSSLSEAETLRPISLRSNLLASTSLSRVEKEVVSPISKRIESLIPSLEAEIQSLLESLIDFCDLNREVVNNIKDPVLKKLTDLERLEKMF